MPNWNEIQREWESNEITFKDLAEKHDVKDSTIRSRKNREKWQRANTTKNATQSNSAATGKRIIINKREVVIQIRKISLQNGTVQQ